jgi:hypothetical protein
MKLQLYSTGKQQVERSQGNKSVKLKLMTVMTVLALPLFHQRPRFSTGRQGSRFYRGTPGWTRARSLASFEI